MVSQVFSQSRSSFIEKHGFARQMGEMYLKYWFYSNKNQSIFIEKSLFFHAKWWFRVWERDPTETQTNT